MFLYSSLPTPNRISFNLENIRVGWSEGSNKLGSQSLSIIYKVLFIFPQSAVLEKLMRGMSENIQPASQFSPTPKKFHVLLLLLGFCHWLVIHNVYYREKYYVVCTASDMTICFTFIFIGYTMTDGPTRWAQEVYSRTVNERIILLIWNKSLGFWPRLLFHFTNTINWNFN